MDPNNDKPDTGAPNPDPAAAAAGDPAAAPTPAPTPEPKPDADTAAMDAFDKGVAIAKGEVPDPNAAAPAVVEGEGALATDKDKPTPETGKEVAPAAAAAPAATTAPDPKQAVEDEIKALGITNERTQKRFRELSERAAEAEPLRARAARADEWEDTVLSTGANPEQFGAALGYLRAVNSGDPTQMRAAYDQVAGELKTLGEMLGIEAPGVDPLEAHPDLKAAVASADMDRAFALELAQRRQAERLHTQADTTRTSAQLQEQERVAGIHAVAELGARLRQSDPHFEAKSKALAGLVNTIQSSLPPPQWASAIEKAWAAAPAPAAPQPKPAPSTQPLRPTGASVGQIRKPQNDVEAFDFGVQTAKAAGQ